MGAVAMLGSCGLPSICMCFDICSPLGGSARSEWRRRFGSASAASFCCARLRDTWIVSSGFSSSSLENSTSSSGRPFLYPRPFSDCCRCCCCGWAGVVGAGACAVTWTCAASGTAAVLLRICICSADAGARASCVMSCVERVERYGWFGGKRFGSGLSSCESRPDCTRLRFEYDLFGTFANMSRCRFASSAASRRRASSAAFALRDLSFSRFSRSSLLSSDAHSESSSSVSVVSYSDDVEIMIPRRGCDGPAPFAAFVVVAGTAAFAGRSGVDMDFFGGFGAGLDGRLVLLELASRLLSPLSFSFPFPASFSLVSFSFSFSFASFSLAFPISFSFSAALLGPPALRPSRDPFDDTEPILNVVFFASAVCGGCLSPACCPTCPACCPWPFFADVVRSPCECSRCSAAGRAGAWPRSLFFRTCTCCLFLPVATIPPAAAVGPLSWLDVALLGLRACSGACSWSC